MTEIILKYVEKFLLSRSISKIMTEEKQISESKSLRRSDKAMVMADLSQKTFKRMHGFILPKTELKIFKDKFIKHGHFLWKDIKSALPYFKKKGQTYIPEINISRSQRFMHKFIGFLSVSFLTLSFLLVFSTWHNGSFQMDYLALTALSLLFGIASLCSQGGYFKAKKIELFLQENPLA